MKDLSLHVLDILENSAKAGATLVTIQVTWRATWLDLEISDNGPGLPESVRVNPTDPFLTTRTDRGVGLGLAMLESAARRTGGTLSVCTAPGGGVHLRACVDVSHVDAQPVGPLEDALCAAMLAWPGLDLLVSAGPVPAEILDTREVRKQLDSVEIGATGVQVFLHRQLREELAPLYAWEAACSPTGGGPGKEGERS